MASRSAFGRDKHNGMPGSSRSQLRAEAKYNVTTDFPRYDLHFAAASGNLGLVEFAISHGQPINSVLNGVLPLHAACAGGNEVVVKYLIQEGADVNAPRLPRRYSNEKHRSSGLAVGASGSTPLHFAAANGHIGVVRLLLEHGAVPDRADKHGVTPQKLAKENGWVECAELLGAWEGRRVGDLPPINGNDATKQQGSTLHKSGTEETSSNMEERECNSKRLQVKRSIDNALHLFRSPLTHYGSHGQLRERERERQASSPRHHHSNSFSQQMQHQDSRGAISLNSSNSANSTSDASYAANGLDAQPSGEYYSFFSLSPTSNTSSPVVDSFPDQQASSSSQQQSEFPPSGDRRPSLPHIFQSAASGLEGVRRRPRSASSDNEQHQDQIRSQGIRYSNANANKTPSSSNGTSSATPSGSNSGTVTARKLSSKISLRNLFRRTGGDASAGGSEPSSSNASAANSFSNSSTAPIHLNGNGKMAQTPTPPASPLGSSFFSATPPPSSYPSAGIGKQRSRLGSDVSASSPAQPPRSPLIPSAVELHHRYSQELVHPGQNQIRKQSPDAAKSPSRPSILREHKHHHHHHHNRSASAQSANVGRTLRFDNAASRVGPVRSSSSNLYGSQNAGLSAGSLRASRSASSLRHTTSFDDGNDEAGDDEEDEEDYGSFEVQTKHRMNLPESAPAKTTRYADEELEQATAAALDSNKRNKDKVPSNLASRYTHMLRSRGDSFASTISSSPGVSPENLHASYANGEFPFSIENPPLTPVSTNDMEASLGAGEPEEEDAAESRLRGESFSSVETDKTEDSNTSGNPLSQGSIDNVTDGTDITIPSPGDYPIRTSILLPHGELIQASLPKVTKASIDDIYPPLRSASPTSSLSDYDGLDDTVNHATDVAIANEERQEHSPVSTISSPLSLAPLDLSGISNLAEAEALVQRAQQAIMMSASMPQDGPGSPSVPLSVQLAAYGEILALERRFARGEKQRLREIMTNAGSDSEGGAVQEREELGRLRNRSGSGGTGATKPRVVKEDLFKKENKDKFTTIDGAYSALATKPNSPSYQKKKTPKYRRPHTAEGAPQTRWGVGSQEATSTESSLPGSLNQSAIGPGNSSLPQLRVSQVYSHSRSSSTPTPLLNKSAANIEIIETTATPLDSPELEEGASAARTQLHLPSDSTTPKPIQTPKYEDFERGCYTIDDERPSLTFRARTPDPEWKERDQDGMAFSTGIPLTRVATAPLTDTGVSYGNGGGGSVGGGSLSGMTRRTDKAKKLTKMGFGVDQTGNMNAAYSPGSSAGSSRSPSKARFGGIKSLVRGLKGKQ